MPRYKKEHNCYFLHDWVRCYRDEKKKMKRISDTIIVFLYTLFDIVKVFRINERGVCPGGGSSGVRGYATHDPLN